MRTTSTEAYLQSDHKKGERPQMAQIHKDTEHALILGTRGKEHTPSQYISWHSNDSKVLKATHHAVNITSSVRNLEVLFLLISIFFLIIVFILILVVVIIFISIQIDHGILFILIFGDEIADILVSFLELHLIHALSLVPVQERLPLVHLRELRTDPLEHALDGSGIGHESCRHGGSLWRHVDNGRLDVIGDPRHEVIRHLGLDFGNLIIHLVGGNGTTVSTGCSQVLTILSL